MNKMIIKDMDVFIELSGLITSVIGPEASGKTCILKKLCNKIDNKDIFIDDICIKDYDFKFLRQNIVVVLNDDNYNEEIVSDELYSNIIKLGLDQAEINKRIAKLVKIFKIEKILNTRLDNLPTSEKILIKILSFLVINPTIIGIDALLDYLDPESLEIFFKYIKDNQINLINITNNIDLIMRSENTIIMNNLKAIVCASTKSITNGNSILPYIGINLPFSIELSHNLILYNLIDKPVDDYRKLVDELWK